MSDPHDSNLRRAADFCRELGRDASAEAISRAIDRIAALEAALAAERERREAAEALLRGVRTSTIDQLDFEIAPLIDAHFARYKN